MHPVFLAIFACVAFITVFVVLQFRVLSTDSPSKDEMKTYNSLILIPLVLLVVFVFWYHHKAKKRGYEIGEALPADIKAPKDVEKKKEEAGKQAGSQVVPSAPNGVSNRLTGRNGMGGPASNSQYETSM